MKNRKISVKTEDFLWLLAITLGLAVMGLLSQTLGNSMEEYVYTHRIVRYWVCVALVCAGAFWLWKAMNTFRCRNPLAFRTVQTALLVVLFILNGYVLVAGLAEDVSFYNWDVRGSTAYSDALWQSKLIGRAANVETLLPDLFWRWEANAVLPALGMGYGLAAVVLYIWLAWMWLAFSVQCLGHLRGETWLTLSDGEEVILAIDVAKLVYLTAFLALVPKVVFQILPPVLGVRIFSGGILFSPWDVAYLAWYPTEAGILQLLTMAYLVYLPGCEDAEEDEEEEALTEPADPEPLPEQEEGPEVLPAPAPEAAEPSRELTAEDFAGAEYTSEAHEWDEEHSFPYFHVPGGWYYMTDGMAAPKLMEKGQSVLVGRYDSLRRMDPGNPGVGEHLFWE